MNHTVCTVNLTFAQVLVWEIWGKNSKNTSALPLSACPLSSIGVYVIGFSFPVVPKGKARIRVQISAAHTDADIDRTVEAFIQTGRKHGVIS